MEVTPHFNFRDVLWAPARALSAKQIYCMTLFLVAALAVYDLFCYAAFIIDGQSPGSAWSVYGFFPFSAPSFGSYVAGVVFFAGVALALFSIMLGFFAVSAINIEAARGNRFFTARQAIKFAFNRLSQLFLAELAIALFVGFIILLFFLLGLVTRLPFVGEWIYAILFVIPNFVIALFSVFIIFVFVLTFLLLPAVAAAERHGETFAAILETFSTIIRQPFRWAGYTAYSLLAAKICGFIYAYFSYRAIQFLVWSTSLGGGDRLENLVKAGLGHLPYRSDLVRETFNIFPGIDFGVSFSTFYFGSSDITVGYLIAAMLFLVFAGIFGYMLAVVAAAQAWGLVALRFIKDGYNIADEDPLFFTDEHVNPEISE